MFWFWFIGSYIVSWIFTLIGVKLDEIDDVLDVLKEGHLFWLFLPFINVISGIVFLVWGIRNYFEDNPEPFGRLVDWLFINREKE